MYSFPKVMSREEALKISQQKGGVLWKMVFQSMPLTKIQLYYFEYKLIKLDVVFEQSLLSRMFSNKSQVPKRMQMIVLGNGTTGGVAVVESHPDLHLVEAAEDEEIQYAYCKEENMMANAKKLAVRLLHRMRGGVPSVESVEMQSVFRPHWVAFYGDYAPGRKVRYKVIPADGYNVNRRF